MIEYLNLSLITKEAKMKYKSRKPMGKPAGTPYDRNPARFELLMNRSKKNDQYRRAFLLAVFSTIIIGFTWGVGQIL